MLPSAAFRVEDLHSLEDCKPLATEAGTVAGEARILAVDEDTVAAAEETEVVSTTGIEEKYCILVEKGLQAENRKRYL